MKVATEGLTLESLAKLLQKESRWELKAGEKITILGFSLSDFIDAAIEPKAELKLRALQKALELYELQVHFSGSLSLDAFNLGDLSWTLSAGKDQSFFIYARPLPLKKSLSSLVQFLSLLPPQQGLSLKAHQDLILDSIPAEALLSYYQFCQLSTDAIEQEKEQENLFRKHCPILEEKKLTLKIWGLNVSLIERHIDIGGEALVYRPKAEGDKAPALVLALFPKN